MNPEIAVALISFAGSSVGVLAGVFGANKLTDFRLKALESKVNEIDTKIDHMADFNTELALIKQRINNIERGE